MFCIVYPLKFNGQRLPPDAARQGGIHGDLRITRKRPSGMPAVEAKLLDDNGSVLLTLSQAEVRQIDAAGILIWGYQGGGSGWDLVAQVWWCETNTNPGQPSALAPRGLRCTEPGTGQAEV